MPQDHSEKNKGRKKLVQPSVLPSNGQNWNSEFKCDNDAINCCHRKNRKAFGGSEKKEKTNCESAKICLFAERKRKKAVTCPVGKPSVSNFTCLRSMPNQGIIATMWLCMKRKIPFCRCSYGLVRKFLLFLLRPSTIRYWDELKSLNTSSCEWCIFYLKHLSSLPINCSPVQRSIMLGRMD